MKKVQHSLPPRRDTSGQLIDSSTGSDLNDASADGQWRCARQCVGFDSRLNDPTSVIGTEVDDEDNVLDLEYALNQVEIFCFCAVSYTHLTLPTICSV